MECIDENFNLYFKIKNGEKIEVNKELSDKLKKLDKSSFPKDSKIILGSGPFFKISFEEGSNFIINYYQKCIQINNIEYSEIEFSCESEIEIKEKNEDEYNDISFFKLEIVNMHFIG